MAQILLVDDEPGFRGAVRLALTREGHGVIEGCNGGEGMRLLERYRPDLVLLDLLMPRMDGLEMILAMRERLVDTPVIAMSGGGAGGLSHSLQVALKLGAACALEKPFTPAELGRAIIQAFESQFSRAWLLKRLDAAKVPSRVELDILAAAAALPGAVGTRAAAILDGQRQVLQLNHAGRELADFAEELSPGRRFGEVFRCAVAARCVAGCGFSPECADCPLRGAIRKTLQLQHPLVGRVMSLTVLRSSECRRLSLVCSTYLLRGGLPNLVLVVLGQREENGSGAAGG